MTICQSARVDILMRLLAVLCILWLAIPALACTFCSGGLLSQQTLREQYAQATIVLQGRLKNPKFSPDGVGGSTELHVEHVLKVEANFGTPKVVVIPRYLPIIGDTPSDYLVFGTITNGRFDVTYGLPATATTAAYLRGLVQLPKEGTTQRLGYCFRHLDSPDAAIVKDAYLELGKASDSDLMNAKAVFDATKLRHWLTDPQTPAERLGVFALLLGACGHAEDGKVFQKLLQESPHPERVRGNLGGLLAGFILLNPQAGWDQTASLLSDGTQPIAGRIAAVGTVRFFQTTHAKTSRLAILGCYRKVIQQGELADLVIEDLRRWGWWELTPDVLAALSATPNPPPILRRGVVRYALSCPDASAKVFLTRMRQVDHKLVESVEESLKLYEAAPAKP
ncbi:MAG: hypothetical protein LC104_20510 [Bacteroidales bacterium]|nr:hypothetical protein [Bacteroidales bacterium]